MRLDDSPSEARLQINSSRSLELAETFHRDGFVVVPRVFEPLELQDLAEHVKHLRQPSRADLVKYGAEPLDLFGRDSLASFTPQDLRMTTRLLRLHLFDERIRQLLLDDRLFSLVRCLFPGEPLAVHAGYFPKPPGGRGIALHADTTYLPVDPHELVGCSIAVDDADAENGALALVRATHRMTNFERHAVSTEEFIFPEGCVQPPETELVLRELKAGDVLLFHGSILHCSAPNRTTHRWRRTFLCHYISAAVRSVADELNPAFRCTGEEIPAPGHTSTCKAP